MDCTQAEELIATAVDGALGAADRAELERHVHECAACRSFRDDLAGHDRELRAAFEGPRAMAAAVAARTIDALRREPAPARGRLLRLAVPLASAAAGFLVAWVVAALAPPDFAHQQEPVPVKRPTGRLVLALGAVEIAPRDGAFAPAHAGDAFEMGAAVRCGPETLAEVETSEGSRVRLNRGCEVEFTANRNLRLRRGEILARVAPSPSGLAWRVATSDGTVATSAGTLDVEHAPHEEGKKVLETHTALIVLDGLASFDKWRVGGGEGLRILGGACEGTSVVRDAVMATRWVHPLLALSPDRAELDARAYEMASELAGHHERELRSLGEDAGPSIVRFLREGSGRPEHRAAAARLASDLCGPAAVPELIELLADREPGVRGCAFAGLARLTGETLGQTRGAWESGGLSCTGPENPQAAWRQRHSAQQTGVRAVK